MLRRSPAGRRDDAATQPSPVPTTLPQMALLLARERARRGLSLLDASRQLGYSVSDLEALEGGVLNRLPQDVQILSTLRAYAHYLGLPGDQYALFLLEEIPPTRRTNGVEPGPVPSGDTLAVAAQPGAIEPAAPLVVDEWPTYGDHLEGANDTTGIHGSTAPVPQLVPDTGVTPAVKGNKPGRRRGASVLVLRSVVIVLLVLVVLGAGGLAVNRWHPGWLKDLRLPHTNSNSTAPPTAVRTTTPTVPVYDVSTAGPTTTITVRSPRANLVVGAVGGPAWIQVSGSGGGSPLYAQVLNSGQTKDFPLTSALQVTMGSSAAKLAVTVDGKIVGIYAPTAAPSNVTVNPT